MKNKSSQLTVGNSPLAVAAFNYKLLNREFKYLVYCLLLIANCLLATKTFAHGDEDHGEKKPHNEMTGKLYFTVNSISETFELVLRYEPIDAGKPAKMKLFVSDFETNKAIDSARIEITCLDDTGLKFQVKQTEQGVYSIEGSFPENKAYILVAHISTDESADLMTLEGIQAGRMLPQTEDEHTEEASEFDWKIIMFAILAFIAGILITLFILRKKQGIKKGMSIMLAILAISIPLNPTQTAYAHEDHNHGEEKNKSGITLTDEVEILKETQFLFDIHTTPSQYSDYYNTLKLYGKVMPSTNGVAEIIAVQSGSIISLNTGIGEKVGKGQILAVMEQNLTASEQIQISTEKSNATAELETAEKEYERLKSIKDIVAKKDLQQAEIRYETARQNKKVYDNLTSGNSKLITIKSPIDGVVDNFNLAIGQQVKQGEAIFNVYDIRKLKIEAQVFDRDMGKITKEVKFFVECVQENHRTENATLIAYGNVVNPVNQSSQIILEIDNSEDLFKPGQFVNVDVMAQVDKKQLVVPTSAISDINGQPIVFIHHEPELFKVMYVQTGEANSENTIILKGLEENERVVTNGVYQVKSIYMNQ